MELDRNAIELGLSASLDSGLVRELLETYEQAKRNHSLGGRRLSAVEGGRFCEAAFRLLQQRATGSFTPLGHALDTDSLIRQLANLPATSEVDSVRLHIPRALRVVYDVRNNRDAAHLADGIDPNVQDAMLVIGVLDWVLAEFVRLYHTVTPDEAQAIVENLVTRSAPAVQDFDGFLKVLKPSLSSGDHSLLLLYHRGAVGAMYDELTNWARPTMRSHLRRTLGRLVEASLAHNSGDRYFITNLGILDAEARGLPLPT